MKTRVGDRRFLDVLQRCGATRQLMRLELPPAAPPSTPATATSPQPSAEDQRGQLPAMTKATRERQAEDAARVQPPADEAIDVQVSQPALPHAAAS